MQHIGTAYLSGAGQFAGWQRTVSFLAHVIRTVGIDFDSIWCRGMSGVLVTPAVAATFNKPFGFLRKPGQSHSMYTSEGPAEVKRYIIIDDLISSGATVAAIHAGVTNHSSQSEGAICAGIFLYGSSACYAMKVGNTMARVCGCNMNSDGTVLRIGMTNVEGQNQSRFSFWCKRPKTLQAISEAWQLTSIP